MTRTVIFGIVLLIATAVGVKLLMDNSSSNGASIKNAEDSKLPPKYVFTWGYFDVEAGVAPLSPKQFGNVVHVTAENTTVKQGDVLLQLDDVQARLTVELAKADVTAGERMLDEAKLLTENYKLQRDQQEAALRSLDSEIKELTLDRDSKIQSVVDVSLKKTLEARYAEGLTKLQEKKKAEHAKLKQVELQDAKLKIALADADLSAKKVRLKQAVEMLKHYQIAAPSAGIVLRSYVHKGEALGPGLTRTQALDFLPEGKVIVRAEVLQEWGRFVREVKDDKASQTVEIEDDTYAGPQWEGKIKSISNWYAPTRTPVIEPFRYNDVRTLECIIELTSGDARKFIGQRVRAKIKIDPVKKS